MVTKSRNSRGISAILHRSKEGRESGGRRICKNREISKSVKMCSNNPKVWPRSAHGKVLKNRQNHQIYGAPQRHPQDALQDAPHDSMQIGPFGGSDTIIT